jgi:ABC-2 type transport system ATP-binding protein
LEIKKGEIFGLLGTNGAGKTTLIKIMAGLLEANSGTGKVLGYDIYKDHKKIRANVSLVAPTADIGTDNNLTVRQNLEFWAVVYNLKKEKREERIDEILAFLGLKEYESFWPMSISAGMRQKLAIARSLLVQNPILFLDEPTVKLDAKSAESIREFIKKINKEFNTTIILTTHFIFEAEELCNRVAIMDRGKIINCDTVDRLRNHLEKYDNFIIHCDNIDKDLVVKIKEQNDIIDMLYEDGKIKITTGNLQKSVNSVVKLLRRENINIYSISTEEYSLEDIFIKMTSREG